MQSHSLIIMILHYITYLNGSSQVHIPERAQVEQECVFFHLSSASLSFPQPLTAQCLAIFTDVSLTCNVCLHTKFFFIPMLPQLDFRNWKSEKRAFLFET